MASAHEEVCGILRRTGSTRGPVEVGFTKNWTVFEAYRAHQLWDRAVAFVSNALFNRFVLREFLGGSRRETATFLGFNYYGRVRFNHFRALVPVGGHTRAELAAMGIVCDDMFERHPSGMETTLIDLHTRHRLPIYITEHGSASDDDEFRTADLRENLAAVHRAITRGADVRGFY
jgi:beta-glucosidase